uniref:Phosphorylated adapter RNA export protein n=1 Tax=Panagrolaimus sp. PS1159 TaxID=55785 RepID=A0AC35FNR6_9BILA
MSSLMRHRRSSSQSSSASLEDGELINEEEFKSDPRISPQSGRTNANLWRDIANEQNLEEQLQMGPLLTDGEVTRRGAETYALPNFEKMDHDELVKQQQVVNESLQRVVTSHSDELFNPSEDVDNEYGVSARRFRKRYVPSDRIPVASAEAERNKEDNAQLFKKARYQNDKSQKKFGQKHSVPSSENPSRCNSRQDFNNKKQKFGSKSSINSGKSDTSNLPIPVSLLNEGYSLEKLLNTVLDEDMDEEDFGICLADALGELKPELMIYTVKILGTQTTNRIFKKTQEVENAGGMHVDNHSRRRTPGGVYLKLLRSDKIIPAALRDNIRDHGQRLLSQEKERAKKEEASLPSLRNAADVIKPVISNDIKMQDEIN